MTNKDKLELLRLLTKTAAAPAPSVGQRGGEPVAQQAGIPAPMRMQDNTARQSAVAPQLVKRPKSAGRGKNYALLAGAKAKASGLTKNMGMGIVKSASPGGLRTILQEAFEMASKNPDQVRNIGRNLGLPDDVMDFIGSAIRNGATSADDVAIDAAQFAAKPIPPRSIKTFGEGLKEGLMPFKRGRTMRARNAEFRGQRDVYRQSQDMIPNAPNQTPRLFGNEVPEVANIPNTFKTQKVETFTGKSPMTKVDGVKTPTYGTRPPGRQGKDIGDLLTDAGKARVNKGRDIEAYRKANHRFAYEAGENTGDLYRASQRRAARNEIANSAGRVIGNTVRTLGYSKPARRTALAGGALGGGYAAYKGKNLTEGAIPGAYEATMIPQVINATPGLRNTRLNIYKGTSPIPFSYTSKKLTAKPDLKPSGAVKTDALKEQRKGKGSVLNAKGTQSPVSSMPINQATRSALDRAVQKERNKVPRRSTLNQQNLERATQNR